MPYQQVGDRCRLLHGDQVRGAGYDGEAGVRYPGDQRAGLGGSGDLVVGADENEGGDADVAQFDAYVERGERLAGRDVAAGVGGAHHSCTAHWVIAGCAAAKPLVNQRSGEDRAIGSRPLLRTITPRCRNSSADPKRGEAAITASEAIRSG